MLSRRSEARMGLMTAGGSFRLQKGEGVGMGEGVYVRTLNVVLYSSNLFQEHDVQERPELVPPPDNCKIIKEGSVPSHL